MDLRQPEHERRDGEDRDHDRGRLRCDAVPDRRVAGGSRGRRQRAAGRGGLAREVRAGGHRAIMLDRSERGAASVDRPPRFSTLARMPGSRLRLTLESELPAELAVGRGSALFVCGWCFSPAAAIESLAFVVDGSEQPVAAHSMPRLDPFRALHPGVDPYATADMDGDPRSAEDPELRSYRSGFWGLVRVGPRPAGELAITLRARLAGGDVAQAPVGTVAVVEPEPALPWWEVGGEPAEEPSVVICMAAYNPAPELIETQVALDPRADAWQLALRDLRRLLRPRRCRGDRPRGWRGPPFHGFPLAPPPGLLPQLRACADAGAVPTPGWWRSPTRTIAGIPTSSRRWSPRSATRGWSTPTPASSPVTARVIADTWWDRRRNNHSDLLSLLVANSVTGAASLLRRELLADALPFPPGPVRPLPRPLAGAGGAVAGRDRLRRPAAVRLRPARGGVAGSRRRQPDDLAARPAAVRQRRCASGFGCGGCTTSSTSAGCGSSPRSWSCACGRGSARASGVSCAGSTRGDESPPSWRAWRLRGAARAGRAAARDARRGVDAGPRARLAAAAGAERARSAAAAAAARRVAAAVAGAAARAQRRCTSPRATIADKIAPLRWRVADDEPARINLLIPTIDLRHFFGGYIAKFNLAAQAGRRAASGCGS